MDIFHIKTLFITIALASSSCAVAIFILHKLKFSIEGTLYWAYGSLIIACSIILLILRGILPDFVTIIIANIGIVYGLSLGLTGLRVFLGRSSILKFTLISPLALAPFLFWYSEIEPSLSARIVVFSLGIVAFSAAIAYELIGKNGEKRNTVQLLGGIVFAINSVISIIRIIFTLFQLPEGSYFTSGMVTIGYGIWALVFIILLTSGIIMMINEKFHSEIKILRGILPICSNCKMVRDDKGYWNSLEKYINDYSEAELSHSLCPLCAKKLFPNLPNIKG